MLRLSAVPLRMLGRLEEAGQRVELARAVLAEYEKATGEQVPFMRALVTAEAAMVAAARKEGSRAREQFDEAIRIEEAMVAKSPTRLDYHAVLSLTLERAAAHARAGGDGSRGCQMQQRRLEAWRRWNQANTRSPYSLEAERQAERAAGECTRSSAYAAPR